MRAARQLSRGGRQSGRTVRYAPQPAAGRHDEMTRPHDTQPMRIPTGASAPADAARPAGSSARVADTEPIAPPETTTDPGAPPDEAEPARPPMPYEPSTTDAKINSLLSRLKPARAPTALTAASTDGDLAAKYHAPLRDLPNRNRTPVPEPKLVLDCTAELPPVSDRDRTTARLRLPGEQVALVPSPIPTVVLPREPAYALPGRRPVVVWAAVVLSAVTLFSLVIAALWSGTTPRGATVSTTASLRASTVMSALPLVPPTADPAPPSPSVASTASADAPTKRAPSAAPSTPPPVRSATPAPRASSPAPSPTPQRHLEEDPL